MHQRGYFPVGTGQYGPNTLRMVKQLQRLNGLVPNGYLGPNTWRLAWTGRYAPPGARAATPRIPAFPGGSHWYTYGETSRNIKIFQDRMHQRGYFPVGTGQYGPNTLRMVKQLQRLNGLVPNGLIGPEHLAPGLDRPLPRLTVARPPPFSGAGSARSRARLSPRTSTVGSPRKPSVATGRVAPHQRGDAGHRDPAGRGHARLLQPRVGRADVRDRDPNPTPSPRRPGTAGCAGAAPRTSTTLALRVVAALAAQVTAHAAVGRQERRRRARLVDAHDPGDRAGVRRAGRRSTRSTAPDAGGRAVRPAAVDVLEPADREAAGAHGA